MRRTRAKFLFSVPEIRRIFTQNLLQWKKLTPSLFLTTTPASKFRVGGGQVLSPEAIRGRSDVLVLICSAQPKVQREVSAQLKDLGVSFLSVDEYIFSKRISELVKCAEILEDEESAEAFAEIIESRLMNRFPEGKIFNRYQYFALPEFCTRSEKEIFVDCGAFVGDTIEDYIFTHGGTFGKIFAFEPDSINFAAMATRVERLNIEWALPKNKIQLVDAGAGRKTKHAALSSMISEQENSGGDSIKIYALDDFLAEQKIDFLKADIESFELDMLQGAEKIIRRDLPKMAICIYHNASDMYQILLWLAKLDLGYKFSIRHHSPANLGTVLYAYH